MIFYDLYNDYDTVHGHYDNKHYYCVRYVLILGLFQHGIQLRLVAWTCAVIDQLRMDDCRLGTLLERISDCTLWNIDDKRLNEWTCAFCNNKLSLYFTRVQHLWCVVVNCRAKEVLCVLDTAYGP